MQDEKKSPDILGVQPLAEAVKIVTKGTVDGAAAFLSRICLPAAEEFGLLLKDRVSHWRTRNLVAISEKAERILEEHGGVRGRQAHPRIINEIIENGSWADEDDVQAMWAGLLSSSCTADGRDESSLLFINLLGQVTKAQARLLHHTCKTADKRLSLDGLLYAESLTLTPDQLYDIWQDHDLHRIDRELDHLRALELIDGGFPLHNEASMDRLYQKEKMRRWTEGMQKRQAETSRRLKEKNKQVQSDADPEEDESPVGIEVPPLCAKVTPTAIALHLYVRSQGCRTSPTEFFGLKPAS